MDFLSAFKYKLSHSSYFNNLLMSQARSTCLHTVAKSFLEFQLIPQIVFPIGTDGKDLSILLLYFHLTHEFLPLYQEVRSLKMPSKPCSESMIDLSKTIKTLQTSFNHYTLRQKNTLRHEASVSDSSCSCMRCS